jgi:hypothetical protein
MYRRRHRHHNHGSYHNIQTNFACPQRMLDLDWHILLTLKYRGGVGKAVWL